MSPSTVHKWRNRVKGALMRSLDEVVQAFSLEIGEVHKNIPPSTLTRWLKTARVPSRKTLDGFDFSFQPLLSERRLCELADLDPLSENEYFNWRKRSICQRKQDDTQLSGRIEDAFYENREVSGSPRIHAELQEQGIHCGRKRIVRLMREKQISAKKKRRKARKTDSTHHFPLASNLLERNFMADAPNEKWMTDMTFIATYEGWLYLAGVIDAYSRRLIGWAMGKEHDAELVKKALHMARIVLGKTCFD